MLTFCQFSGIAQTRFGIKAGVNTVDIKKEQLDVFDADGRQRLRLAIKDANYGVNIGLFVLARSERFFIQPELLYSSNSTDFRVDSTGAGGEFIDKVFKERYQNLDIPVMAGLRFGFLRIGAGPVGHVHLSSTSDLIDFDGYKEDFKSLTMGYQGGIGIDLSSIHVDIRYEGNLTKYGDHMEFFGRDISFSDRPTRILATIGISF